MPGPGGKSAGRVSIRVVPDSTGFRQQLKADLDKAEKDLKVNVDIGADAKGFKATLDKLKAQAGRDDANVNVDADTKEAAAKLAEVSRSRTVDLAVKIRKSALTQAKKLMGAAAGISGVKDLQEQLTSFLHIAANLGDIAPNVAKKMLIFGSIGALAGGAAHGIFTLASSVSQLAGLAAAAPAGILAMAAAIPILTVGISALGKQLKGLPALTSLQNTIGSAFTKASVGPIKGFLTLLAQAKTQVSGLSSALGGLVGGAASTLTQSLSGGGLTTFATNLTNAVNQLAPGLQAIVAGFTQMGIAGSKFLPQLAAWLGTIGTQFGNWMKQVAGSGQLTVWVGQAVTILKQLWSVAGAALSIITGIMGAAQNAGGGGLTAFLSVLQQIAQVINSPAVQAGLTTLFQGAMQGVSGLLTALQPIGQLLITLAPAISQLFGMIGSSVGQILTTLAGALSSPAIASGFIAFMQGVSNAVSALMPVLSALGPFVGALAAAFGQILTASSGLPNVMLALLQAFQPLIPLLGGVFVQAIQLLVPLLAQLVPPLAGFVTQLITGLLPVITALMPPFVQLIGTLITGLLPVIQALIPPVLSFVSALLSGLLPVIVQLAPVFVQLAQFAGQVAMMLLTSLAPVIPTLSKYFVQLIKSLAPLIPALLQILQAFLPLLPAVLQLLPPILQLAIMFLQSLTPGIKMVASILTHVLVPSIQASVAIMRVILTVASTVLKELLDIFTGKTDALKSLWSDTFNKIVDIVKGTKLFQIGQQMIQGLINGVTGMAKSVYNAVKGVVQGAVKGAKDFLGISSPSKVFAQIGRYVGQGFVKGVTGTQSQVHSSISKLLGMVDDLYKRHKIGAGQKNYLDQLIKFEGGRLSKLAKLREQDAKALQNANQKLQTAIQARNAYAAQVRDAIDKLGDVTSFGATADPSGANKIVTGLQSAVDKAKEFRTLIGQLTKEHLNNTALQQIIAAGADNGTATAEALVQGGQGAINQVNSLQKQLDQQGKALGTSTSRTFYQAGVDAAQGIVDALKDKKKDLTDIGTQIAAALADSVKKKLKIKSPSRVFKDEVGAQITDGLIAGLNSRQTALDARLSQVVKTPNTPRTAAPAPAAPVVVPAQNPAAALKGLGLSGQLDLKNGKPYIHAVVTELFQQAATSY